MDKHCNNCKYEKLPGVLMAPCCYCSFGGQAGVIGAQLMWEEQTEIEIRLEVEEGEWE